MLADITQIMLMILLLPLIIYMWVSVVMTLHRNWKEWNDEHWHR